MDSRSDPDSSAQLPKRHFYTPTGSSGRRVGTVRWLFTAAAKRRIPSRICSGAALEKFKRMWRAPSRGASPWLSLA
jgi:hypothetical protein